MAQLDLVCTRCGRETPANPEGRPVRAVQEGKHITLRCWACGANRKHKIVKPTRLARRRQQARARHWRRTGVSESVIQWMKEGGWL